jgi:hypothetical protein
MNALANPPETEAVVEPGHRAVFTYVQEHMGLSENDVKYLDSPEARDARAMYFWLCDQLKSTGYVAAGYAIDVSPKDAPGEILRIERQRHKDQALANALEEACLVLHCEAVVLIRKGYARSHEPSITAVARRALGSARAAGMVSVEDIQRLAGAYLGLSTGIELRQARADIAALTAECNALINRIGDQRIRTNQALEAELLALIKSGDVLDRASQAAQPSARKSYEKSIEQLRSAAEKHFGIERKFK